MAESLLIVESPAKARTIKKYLGKDFEVKASVGHVMDLPPNKLGVDIEGGFEPTYEVIKGKDKVLKELKSAAAEAKEIYLAPDPDREGEAIAWHIAQQLGRPLDEYHRVLFHELTRRAITEAVANPTKLDPRLYSSQQARRVLDRLVGYQISPLLWEKVRRGLSAGRVQSVALRLVVERERAIRAFTPKEYWSVEARLKADDPPEFTARLVRIGGKKFEASSQAEADAALKAVSAGPFVVSKLTRRKRTQRPPAPFITSTLQQEAYRKLGMSPRQTMRIAQRLYEGLPTPEGVVGLITYMRTDSTRLAPEAVAEAREFIAQRFGTEFLPETPNTFPSRAGAQEAHEAIRPTSVARTPEQLEGFLSKEELALYRLIWQRFVACQMAPAIYEQTQVEIASGPGLLRATGQVLVFKGFSALYSEGRDEPEEHSPPLPKLEEGQKLELVEIKANQHFTQPPPRFTEASLVRELEEKGIGRPSTYATILATLQDKGYVTKQKGRLVPTELGMVVCDLLVENFPEIMRVDFTAQLEKALDEVAEGKREWRSLLKEFYEAFSAELERARNNMRQIKGKGLATSISCPTCGKPMCIRLGRNGEFLACSDWPTCPTTREFTRDEKGEIVVLEPGEQGEELRCERCGAPMQLKRSRYGPFYACSAYPKCSFTLPADSEGRPLKRQQPQPIGEKCPRCGAELVIRQARNGNKFISCSNYPTCRYSRGMPTGVACPRCGGQIVEKRSRRGKIFFGCENYPECDYSLWNRPVPIACPACAHPFLVEKRSRSVTILVCPAEGCSYSAPAEELSPPAREGRAEAAEEKH